MWQSTLSGDDLRTLLVLLTLHAAAVTGVIIHSRSDWRVLRHRLFRPYEGLEKLSRPGRVEERLSSERWEAAFHETLERSRRDFEGERNVAAAILMAVENDREAFGTLVKEIASRAMTEGDLRSALVRLDKALVYILVFPGRHEDRRTLRRYTAFSDGWPAHAANVRAVDEAGNSPMISLLYFLGLDARDGTLLVAYEGDDGRRFPAELTEPSGGAINGSSLTYDFALA